MTRGSWFEFMVGQWSLKLYWYFFNMYIVRLFFFNSFNLFLNVRTSSSQHSRGECTPERVCAAEPTGDPGVQVRRRSSPDPHLAQRRSTAAGHQLKKKSNDQNIMNVN